MTNRRFDALFGQPPRRPDEPLTQFHMDVAASIQATLDQVMLRLTRSLRQEFGIKNLCLAGGVALNCVANGKILRDGQFDGLWIQPAAGDAGGALGAALAASGGVRRTGPRRDSMKGSYLGPEFAQAEIEQRLRAAGAVFTVLSPEELLDAAADALAREQALGWFQGRMEFGPRALGNRSILADARSPRMQSTLNLKVKYRESFRPFAPAVLAEHAAELFDLAGDSPYMLLVAEVRAGLRRPMTAEEEQLFGIAKLNVPRSTIPAVTHVDYSARVQTVNCETNPIFHALLRRFHAKTGSPVLVNTSFNVRGEPIVGTPEDAFHCFLGTGIEVLAVGRCFLRKEEQNPALARSYHNAFAPD
ncbi:MAG: carbamoyltransferase, partial [Acidobacteriota bacterium]